MALEVQCMTLTHLWEVDPTDLWVVLWVEWATLIQTTRWYLVQNLLQWVEVVVLMVLILLSLCHLLVFLVMVTTKTHQSWDQVQVLSVQIPTIHSNFLISSSSCTPLTHEVKEEECHRGWVQCPTDPTLRLASTKTGNQVDL